MGKIGSQKAIYRGFVPLPPLWPNHDMERYLYKQQSPASSVAVGPPDPAEPRLTIEKTPPADPSNPKHPILQTW